MGAETTLHMTVGAIVGWAILSPLAKNKGWAPGEVNDWEHGSKGWIVWVSLAIMLVDAVVSLSYIAARPLIGDWTWRMVTRTWSRIQASRVGSFLRLSSHGYTLVQGNEDDEGEDDTIRQSNDDDRSIANVKEEDGGDAPLHQRISFKIVWIGLVLSVALCVVTIYIVFGDLVPVYATIIAVLMALVLSIMGVRALGETDLNPVSGISKLAQLFFALIIPQTHKSSVLINLVAGAVVCHLPNPLLTLVQKANQGFILV